MWFFTCIVLLNEILCYKPIFLKTSFVAFYILVIDVLQTASPLLHLTLNFMYSFAEAHTKLLQLPTILLWNYALQIMNLFQIKYFGYGWCWMVDVACLFSGKKICCSCILTLVQPNQRQCYTWQAQNLPFLIFLNAFIYL